MKTRAIPFILSLWLLAFVLSIQAAQAKTLRVATRETPPFSFKGEGGIWRGISIELWEKIAAADHLSFELEETTIEQLLKGLQDGTYDLAVAGTTITADRMKVIDFSQPFISSSLGVAFMEEENPWVEVLENFFSFGFLKILLLLGVVLLIAAVGVWYFERQKNEEFSGKTHHALSAAFWWAAVTMTTVGYGDKSPRTAGGRVIGLIWMFVSIIILTSFTASIVSTLTIASHPTEKSIASLGNEKIGTVKGSASDSLLYRYNIKPVQYDDCKQMIQALLKEEVDNIVYDLPVLRYYGARQGKQYKIVPLKNFRQDYGFAFPLNSPLRKPVNIEMFRMLDSPVWRELRTRHLGDWKEAQLFMR